jgi:aldose 1-epimerase
MSVEVVTLVDSAAGSCAKITAGFGFNCYQFQVLHEGRTLDVLWSAANFDSGKQRPSGSGIPLLFPFPGRIQGVVFEWKGKRYQLQEGDGRGNAIHGFVHARPWRVIEQSAQRVVGQFQASADDAKLLECWPADFRITATYELTGSSLSAHFRIENPDQQPLPCGFGTHPYFRVPLGGASAEDCRVKLPVSSQWELKDMLATGTLLSLDNAGEFHEGLRFGDMALDDAFSWLEYRDGICTTSIYDPGSGRSMVMAFDSAFRECVVYNPGHRQAVCIEPLTCAPDPFRLTKLGIDAGLRVLAPGESFEARVQIRVD